MIWDVPNFLQLDAVDQAILEILSGDARITNNALAERVGVAPSTCLARVKALRESGVLRGFHAEIDLGALGRPLQAMISIRRRSTRASRSRTSRTRCGRCRAS